MLLSYDLAVSCLSIQIPCSPMWQVLQSWCLLPEHQMEKRDEKGFQFKKACRATEQAFLNDEEQCRYNFGHAAFTNVIFNWFSFGNLFFSQCTLHLVLVDLFYYGATMLTLTFSFHTFSDTYFFFSHLFNCISYFNCKILSILYSWSSHYSCQNMTF
jgi:hypothetical protein